MRTAAVCLGLFAFFVLVSLFFYIIDLPLERW